MGKMLAAVLDGARQLNLREVGIRLSCENQVEGIYFYRCTSLDKLSILMCNINNREVFRKYIGINPNQYK